MVAALLVIGGTVFAVDQRWRRRQEEAGRREERRPQGLRRPTLRSNPGDGSGDGGEDAEDLNEGRQAGEAKVLWYKEAPDAPGSGADAPGMWITDKTAVKAAYKQVVAYNVGDGKPTWAPVTFPQKICAVTRQQSADDKIVVAYKSGTSDRAKCNQLQQIDLNTGEKGWKKPVTDGACSTAPSPSACPSPARR